MSQITQNGIITIKFSETIQRPCFLEGKYKKRILTETNEEKLDIVNELLNCKYSIKSDISNDNFKYVIDLIKW